jgi:hypothetical protein
MKRILGLALCLFILRPICSHAQPSDAAGVAAQREAEEQAKRLDADLRSILETQEAIQRRQEEFRQRLDRLDAELRALKEDQNRGSANFVTRDEFRKYVEKLKDLDEKREADKRLILSGIKDLGKAPAMSAAEPSAKTAQSHAAETSDELPFVYTVKKNDRLRDIVAAYNEYFQKHGQSKLTVEQVLKANPGLNPDRLIAGKKIKIPIPAKEGK